MVALLPEIVPRLNRLTWLGWAIVVLGILAILAPLMAGKATVILVALLLLLAGLAQFFDAWQSRQSLSSRVLTLVLGATATIAAIFMLAHPVLGLRVLTGLLVAYLMAEGLWKIAVSLRNRHWAGYGWLLLSGVLSLLLGILIWRQWPLAGTSALGILIGVNLVCTGVALLALAQSMHETMRKAIFVMPGGQT
ncbi:MAG TPA: DUF308 domain-containing protein [Hyphomicrobiaceae bacterium]|nr:DUF308 domain-containing protein [Hyphomicrobiaceae bacterium]